MNNRIIILLVFVLPLAIYGILSTFQPQIANEIKNSYKVEAQNNKMAQILKFSTPLCMDCQKLDKTLEKIMPQYKDKVNLIKYDASKQTEEMQKLIEKYNIIVVPTTIFINSNGTFEKKIEGDIPQNTLENEIKALF